MATGGGNSSAHENKKACIIWCRKTTTIYLARDSVGQQFFAVQLDSSLNLKGVHSFIYSAASQSAGKLCLGAGWLSAGINQSSWATNLSSSHRLTQNFLYGDCASFQKGEQDCERLFWGLVQSGHSVTFATVSYKVRPNSRVWETNSTCCRRMCKVILEKDTRGDIFNQFLHTFPHIAQYLIYHYLWNICHGYCFLTYCNVNLLWVFSLSLFQS